MPVIFRPYLEKLGGDTNVTSYVGTAGDLFYDPDTTTLRISDGETPGGSIVSSSGGGGGIQTLIEYDVEVSNRVETTADGVNVRLNTQLDGGEQTQWSFTTNGFGNGGDITFPSGNASIVTTGDAYVAIKANNGVELNYNDGQGWIGVESGTAYIKAGDGVTSAEWVFNNNGILAGPVEGMVAVSGVVNINGNFNLATIYTAPSWPTIANITKQAEATVLFDDVINEDVPESGTIEFSGIETWTTLNGVKYYYNIISPSEIALFTDAGFTTALDTSGLSGTFIPQIENTLTWQQHSSYNGSSNSWVDPTIYPEIVTVPVGAEVTGSNLTGTETVIDILDYYGDGSIYFIQFNGDSGAGRHLVGVDYNAVWYTEGNPTGTILSVVDGGDVIINASTGQGTTAQPGIISILAPITLANGAVLRDSSTDSIAFGGGAGATDQGASAVALGEGAGNNTQGNQAIALGRGSGNANQGVGAVGIGFCAGATSQGDYSVAIGFKAARGNMDNDGTPNQPANSIMINASSTPLNGDQAGLYINPVREDVANVTKAVYYNTDTKELTYTDPTSNLGGTTTRYVMVNVDGGVFGSTDGVVWDGPADSGLDGISRVAVGPNMVVYIADSGTKNQELYYAASYDTAATAITSTESYAVWRQVRWFDSLNKFVAVGVTDDVPTVRLSSDGITWTTLQLDTEWAGIATGGYTPAGEEFTDVAYNDIGYLFTTNSTVLGSFYITDMDAAIAAGLISGNISGTAWLDDGNNFNDLLWSSAGDFTGWFAFGAGSTGGDTDAWWYNNSTDPSGSAFEPFAISDASFAFVETIGFEPVVSEITIGDYNGISTVVIATEEGQILWWPAVPEGPFISIPKPYTNTDFIITNAEPAMLAVLSGNTPVHNEKIIISNAGSFDGTYYYHAGGGLYIDSSLTLPFDSTSAGSWTTGTMTLSHGQYIDALNYANGKFYAGNDDEEIFVSENGGETWSLVATLSNSPGSDGDGPGTGTAYMNDVDGYIGSGIQTDRLTNGNASLTLSSNGAVSIPGKVVMTTNYPVDGSFIEPTPLDLNKSVQVLTGFNNDGTYSLANGVEGQIMYFTWLTNSVYVLVDNARIRNSSTSAVEVVSPYSWQVDYDSANQEPRTMAMAIFVNGAWNLMGGGTD